jgi:hypothetical protein
VNRVTYVCSRCQGISEDSLRPCFDCGYIGEVIIAIDHSPVTFGELFHYMNRAPKPWPLSRVFIPEPYHYLSVEQLRLVAEARKKGGVIYVLGK